MLMVKEVKKVTSYRLNQSGYTALELLVVLILIVILVVLLVSI